jgi:hypothetical protein
VQIAQVVTVTALAVLGTAATAAADTPAQSALAEAEAAWNDLEPEQVVAAADRALASQPTTAETLDALRLKGSGLVVLDRRPEAEATFELIFDHDSDYALPDGASPDVRLAFRRARATWQVRREIELETELGESYSAIRMTVRAPPSARGGLTLSIPVDLVDPGGLVDEIALYYRRAGDSSYSTLTADAIPGTIDLTLPGAVTASDSGYQYNLYVRARDTTDTVLRRAGDPERPLLISVEAGQVPSDTPWYRNWKTYGVVGAVAVGVTVGILFATRDVGPQNIMPNEL